MPHPDWQLTLAAGMLLAAALVGGLLANMVRLPRVTAYLVVGLLLGPHMLHVIGETELIHLDVVGKLAMALVLFNMGSHFTLNRLRLIMKRALRLSAGELGLTFALVSGGLLALGQSWQTAVLLGTLALATAPATTILVLKENHSEGPITEYATSLVVLNNLVAVFLFELLMLFIQVLSGHMVSPLHVELLYLGRDIVGSIALGGLAGLVVSYSCALLPRGRWFVLLVAIATLLLGGSDALEIPYLLTFLVMGMTVANASDQEKEIAAELDHFTGLLSVVFFVIHGAELNLHQMFEAGDLKLVLIVLAYIALRSAGKYFGIFLVARNERDGPQVRRWLGATLVSQAGAAIALSAIAANPSSGLGEMGTRIQFVILSSVVVFELFGPVLIQIAVRRGGEVPLAHAIRHSTTTPFSELSSLVRRLLQALGFDPWRHKTAEGITVEQVMRRNMKGVSASATFDEVIDYIEQSHDNSFPVVDAEGTLVGVIRYEDLRDALLDPELMSLVRAEDLSAPCPHILYADEPLSKTWHHLREGTDDCIFVVSRDEPHRLVGVVKRRDALHFFAKRGAEG